MRTVYHRDMALTAEAECHPEVSRLISAAVVNKRFRQLLLTRPAEALETGYLGEPFSLESEDRAMILSIRAHSLADFAMQVVRFQGRSQKEQKQVYGIVTSQWGAQQVHQKS